MQDPCEEGSLPLDWEEVAGPRGWKGAVPMVVRKEIGICLALAGAFLAGCGGGGDDGLDPDPFVLGLYAFRVDETLSASELLVTASLAGMDAGISVEPGPSAFTGTVNTRTGGWTIDVGSGFVIDTDRGVDPVFGAFTVTFTQRVVLPGDGPPTEGAWAIDCPCLPVEVVVVPGGIELSIDGGPPVPYDWDDVGDLVDAPGSTQEERIVGFFDGVLEFLMGQYGRVVDILYEIDEDMVYYNPKGDDVANVDPWPPGTDFPPGVTDDGYYRFSWRDTGDGELGPFDNFQLTMVDWPFDNHDGVYRGTLELVNFNEVVSGANALTRVGFGPGGGRDGGVFYDDLEIWQFEDTGGGVFANPLLFEGGFSIVFTAP